MNTFKEILAADITDVFLDLGEFGETHTVNGKPLTVIIDDDISDDTVSINLAGQGERGSTGLYNNQRNMYMAVGDLPGKPKVNSVMNVDSKKYIVKGVSVQCGLFKITVEVVGGR